MLVVKQAAVHLPALYGCLHVTVAPARCSASSSALAGSNHTQHLPDYNRKQWRKQRRRQRNIQVASAAMPTYWDMEHHRGRLLAQQCCPTPGGVCPGLPELERRETIYYGRHPALVADAGCFKQHRNQDGIQGRPWALPQFIDKRLPERSLRLPTLTGLGQPRQQPKHDEGIVAIIDANGTILDKLQPIELSNERTAALYTKPVLQPIKLRDAKRFPDATKPSIHSIADGKGIGWISCMIQATGTLQKKECQRCTNNESPFEGCIAVGGDAFPKCGNCEWNGKSCQGLEPFSPANISGSRSCSLPSHSLTRPKFSGPSSGPPTTAALAKMEASTVAPQTAAAKAYTAHFSPSRVSVSGLKAVSQASMYEAGSPVPGAVPSLAASNTTSYRPCSKPSIPAPPSSCHITKESLVLKHDGRLYIYPACVEGVPVEKITSEHPYWESTWPDLRTLVEPILRSWEEMYQKAEEASRRGKTVSRPMSRTIVIKSIEEKPFWSFWKTAPLARISFSTRDSWPPAEAASLPTTRCTGSVGQLKYLPITIQASSPSIGCVSVYMS